MSLKQKTIKGLFWSFVSQGGKQVSSLIITAVLARLLSPSDFGIVGMAVVFTGFGDVFKDLGLSKALIQKQDIDNSHLYSAFWINIGFGLLLTSVIILISPLIALFYNKPELKPILIVLSFNFIISSLTIIHQTILTKEMDFRSLTIRDIVAIAGSGAVGIILAYKGFGVWSLVFQMLSYTILNSFLLWKLSEWRPKIFFSYSAIKDMLHFSINFTGFNIVNYLARNMDYLLIGKFLGPQALGLYTIAHKLMMFPLQNISWVITKVLFPAFSKIHNDLERLKRVYLVIIRSISYISFPLMAGLFIVAPEFVNVVFGPKWAGAIILIRILCICSIFHSLYTTTTSIILSQGKADWLFKLSILNVICTSLAIFIGLNWGLVGVAISYTIEQIAWTIFIQHITNSLISLNLFSYFQGIKLSSVVTFVMFVIVIIARIFMNNIGLFSLTICVFLGVSIYLALLFFFARKEVGELISRSYMRA